MFDDKLVIGSATRVSISAKYSNISAANISRLSLANSFDNDFDCLEVAEISVSESKYSEYTIDVLRTSLTTNSYDDKWKVKQLGSEIRSFNVKSKHGSVDVGLSEELSHIIRYEGKCGDFRYPDLEYTVVKSNMADDKMQLVLKTGNGSASFNFSVYCTDIDIKLN